MADEHLRRLEREDDDGVELARFRAGLCPQCGQRRVHEGFTGGMEALTPEGIRVVLPHEAPAEWQCCCSLCSKVMIDSPAEHPLVDDEGRCLNCPLRGKE